MLIKRYIVNNMNEAMTRIRYELGKDAVIISQRKMRKPGISGFFSKKVIEVTAAVENPKKDEDTSIQSSLDAIRRLMNEEVSVSNNNRVNNTGNNRVNNTGAHDKSKSKINKEQEIHIEEEMSTIAPKLAKKENIDLRQESSSHSFSQDGLIKEMLEMKNMLNEMMNSSPSVTPKKSKLQILLENNDLNEKSIKRILTTLKSINEEITESEKAKMVIEKMIQLSRPKMSGVVVLVGPTGVGKTTTIAKLAGRLALIEKKKVGLITIDTYRIGAVEQLRTYADIMNLPFKVVLTTKEMETAVDSMSDCDVVLIDTTGRSSKNAMQISELRAFVDKANTTNIHLVISCTTKNKDINAIVEGFKGLNYNNVIITKLDETSTYGSIINILDCAGKPLSFITTGQSVPDDIKELTANEITNLILGDDTVC
jgi:flagellar biosynthesis protein FlhF